MSLSRRHLLQSASALGALGLIGCERVPVSDNPPYGPEIKKQITRDAKAVALLKTCLLYTSPSPRDRQKSRMPSSA